MHDLKACIVCLRTNVKIFHLSLDQLRVQYNLISGLKTHSGDGLPEYVCVECFAYIRRFKMFRDKCHRSHYVLQEILHKNKQITVTVLNELNLKTVNITPTLSNLDHNQSKNCYEKLKFKWDKESRSYIEPLHVHVLQHSTFDDDTIFLVPDPKSEPEPLNVDHGNNIKGVENKELVEEYRVSYQEPNLDDNTNRSDDNNDNDLYANDETVKDEINDVDGTNLDEEYAVMVPISNNESKAVVDIYKMYVQSGKLKCKVCGKRYHNEKRLEVHMRMHDTHVNGNYFCELCHFYYKTKFLLKTHIREKHMYKYLCRKCPEVNFDRTSAKQHYIWTHLQKGNKKDSNWYDSRPKWLKKKCPNGQKSVLCIRPVKKTTKIPLDYLKYSPISQEQQYALVEERKNTKNYIDSPYKCEFCYKGFREMATHNTHMKKHDPSISGQYQCDACKIYCKDTRKMYKHMIQSHLYKYACQICSFSCTNRNQAKMHYRWHKNVTYTCPHCDKVYKKASTRLTHIRLKHPSTFICNLCGHSFVSENGLYCHKRMAHSKQEIEEGNGKANADHPLFCVDCDVQFRDQSAYNTHLGSSSKHSDMNLSCMKSKSADGRAARPRRTRRHFSEVYNNGVATATRCEICNEMLLNDQQARKHYDAEHPGSDFRKRYMCDICGHTTKQYSNLMVHMRTHTMEKPYACPHCERRFSMPSNRDRHLVVHTGEKRYECQHCHRRFSQSSAVKLHIQTVHLKIPYAPWDKNNRRRRKELDAPLAAPLTAPLTAPLPAPPALKLAEPHDYLNAYISYNE